MDAPLYPPAIEFEQPTVLPHGLDTTTNSIASLLANPAATAILRKELPGFEARVNSEPMKPQLDSFSFRFLVQFGMFRPADLDRVDVQLRALPQTGGGE